MVSSDCTVTAAYQGGETTINAVHPEILQTHVLTRLDGPTLASAASASSELHAICHENKLWREICNQTWPSITDPCVVDLISTFPAGYRSFFSDSYPTLEHRFPSPPNPRRQSPATSQLISAVDIYYRGKLILSKVHETETVTGWFMCSPFRVDLIDQKETVPTPVKFDGGEDTCLSSLQENLTVSWILIDPTRKRAANISSMRPVSVHRHWLTGEIQVRYATIVAGDRRGSDFVECGIEVTCGGKEGGELHVSEVTFLVEDMDGKSLSGKDSLVILQEALESGKRKKGNKWEGKERYEEYLEMKLVYRERKLRRERRMDVVCMATGITIFMAFWALILFR